MRRIGFIGLGHVGTPMVRNLLKQHHQVKIFDWGSPVMTALPNELYQRFVNEGQVNFSGIIQMIEGKG